MKCDCKVTNEKKIETKEPEKVTKKSVIKSFYNVLKYSNYKVLRCYNLVFRKVTIKENVGSILSNIYFIGYLIAFGIMYYTKGAYLKKNIRKLIKGDDSNGKNTIELNKDDISIFEKKGGKIDDKSNIDEKIKNNDIIEINKKSDNNKLMKFSKDKRNSESSQSGFKFNNTNNDKSIHSRTKKESVVSISENKNLGTKIY